MSERKTAEERARSVFKQYEGAIEASLRRESLEIPTDAKLEVLIAAAIREAEDQALERAARLIVESSPTHQRTSICGDPVYDGFRVGIDHALSAIRSLKSKKENRVMTSGALLLLGLTLTGIAVLAVAVALWEAMR